MLPRGWRNLMQINYLFLEETYRAEAHLSGWLKF